MCVTKVMDTPHLTNCCGQHFCQYCLDHWSTVRNGHSSCPHCRASAFGHVHDKHFERPIWQLDIRCPNSSHGCEWVGHLVDLAHHLKSSSQDSGCRHQLVECPLKCGEKYERRLTQSHALSMCTQRDVCCDHCGESLKSFQLFHHLTKCQHILVACLQGCGLQVPRSDMDLHMKSDCARSITTCPFYDVGCQEDVRRDELESHTHMCKDKYMVKAYQKIMTQMEDLKKEVASLKTENNVLAIKADCLRDGLRQCYSNTNILKHQMECLKSVVLDELEFLHAPCKPCEILSIECLRTGVENQLVHLTSRGNSATYRISNYSMHKETSKAWYSPPFYIGDGYCFCLVVHINGIGSGKGTHVSVFLEQEAGLLDRQLQWPISLNQDLEIHLMWQEPPKRSFFVSSPKSPSKASTASLHCNKRTSLILSPDSISETDLTSTTSEQFRQRTKSYLSEGAPTPPSSPIAPRRATRIALPSSCEAECQVMRVSRRLNQPVPGRFPSGEVVDKMELFCMQKTFSNAVFLDSVILKVSLPSLPGEKVSQATGINNVGWAVWDSKRDRNP